MQHMSAGRGIRHSEFNPSATEPVHLYQIWLLPRESGLPPSYSQTTFSPEGRAGRWQLVASPDAADGSLKIEQDALIYLANVDPSSPLTFDLAASRHAWLQILRGSVNLNNNDLTAGDGVAISNESKLSLTATTAAELMLFDLS
jgi:redox-sensitive bicupin YhaK (pirin superfamily)